MASDESHRPGRQHTSRTAPVIPPIYQTTTFELDVAPVAGAPPTEWKGIEVVHEWDEPDGTGRPGG